VKALTGKRLLVEFNNGVVKTYNCVPLLDKKVFQPLRNDALFRCVHADDHGYAVVWNDDIDLAESELWINGQVIESADPNRTR
jgi:hypothetical protein